VIKGLGEGFSDLYHFVSDETYDWAIYLLRVAQHHEQKA